MAEIKPFRKAIINPLTLVPGGNTLQLIFHEGKTKVQPRIKYPAKYIDKVLNNSEEDGFRLKEVYDITDRNKVVLVWKDGQ